MVMSLTGNTNCKVSVMLKYTTIEVFLSLCLKISTGLQIAEPVATNVNLVCEGVIDGDRLGHHFLMTRHRAFPLFE